MADISFNIACKELKIAQIAKLNQLFQLLHLDHMYGHGFYELSRILMWKNVNNDVSKDSPYSSMQKRLYLGKRGYSAICANNNQIYYPTLYSKWNVHRANEC